MSHADRAALFAALVGFIVFAFRQGDKVKSDKKPGIAWMAAGSGRREMRADYGASLN